MGKVKWTAVVLTCSNKNWTHTLQHGNWNDPTRFLSNILPTYKDRKRLARRHRDTLSVFLENSWKPVSNDKSGPLVMGAAETANIRVMIFD